MNNDKAFALFAFSLVAAVASLFAVAVATGIASLPTLAYIIEHGALGLFIRSAYKSLDRERIRLETTAEVAGPFRAGLLAEIQDVDLSDTEAGGLVESGVLTGGYRIRITAGGQTLEYHGGREGPPSYCPADRVTQPVPGATGAS